MSLSFNRMINLIQDLAQASNAPSLDDVKVDSDASMRDQASDYLQSVEDVDLENKDDYEEIRVKDAEALQLATSSPGSKKKKEKKLKAARKKIVLNWLNRRKPAAFNTAGAEQWATSVVHDRYSDEYANYGGQKYDYEALGGYKPAVNKLALSRYARELTHVFGVSSSEFSQLVTNRANTGFKAAFEKVKDGALPLAARLESVAIQNSDSVTKISSRVTKIYQSLKYLRLLNLGLSSQGTGRVFIDGENEKVFVPNCTYDFVLFPQHFNSSEDCNYAFMWVNEKWIPIHCDWPDDNVPEELK